MIKQFFRLLSAIFVGLILSVWIIQNNSEVELAITKKIINTLEKEWHVKIDTKSSRVNLFTCSLYLNNGHVKYLKKDNCHWSFDQCKVHIQPLAFLRKRKINLELKFDNIGITSGLTDGTPDIFSHVASIFSGQSNDFNIAIKSFCINNLDLNILNLPHTYRAQVEGSCLIQKIKHAKKDNLPNSWQGDLSIKNAQLSIDDKVFIRQFSTSGNFYRSRIAPSWLAKVDSAIKSLIPTPSQSYSINGVWNNDKKYITIKNSNLDFNLDISYVAEKIKIGGIFPAEIALQVAGFFGSGISSVGSGVSGRCQLDFEWLLNDSKITVGSSFSIEDLRIKDLKFGKVILKLKESTNEKLTAAIDFLYNQDFQALGLLKWDWCKSTGKIKLMNKLPVKFFKESSKRLGIGGYEVGPKNFFVSGVIDKDFNLTGDYSLNISDYSASKSFKYDGIFKFEKNELKIKGTTRKGEYEINSQILPSPCLLKWFYKANGQNLIDLQCRDVEGKVLQGSINFASIKSFLPQSTKHLIFGRNCIFNLAVDQSDFFHLHGNIKLLNGKFYIPESRNIIEKLQTDFDISAHSRKIILNNAQIGFFKGEVSSPKIIVQFDENNVLSNLHVPLKIKDLLINWKKDLLAIIYGNVLIKKNSQGNYKALAQLVAKRSILRENILSLPENKSLSSPMGISFLQNNDFDFDIRLSSEQPIKAKTPSLETSASINLRILYQKSKNIMRIPQLTGSIRLDSGHIKFLHTKLYFEYGKVQFISNQMNDPIIDLIARNRINKYQITLQATGSLQKPIILLESNPELTEEQILGLLLSGSEAAKLQTDLFAMLEQNLHDIVLGNKTISPGATSFFQKLAKPFKYIQITPDFTNQSARGGIKGTISANLSEQVKAQIQKNFNMQDDFNAQVEYQLSDDVSLKGSVDQRGELGAEVELRLKL
ncbi:MAG: translocation/assembly module TamB domain-containing protein [Candidatus Babeliales bacterium]